MRLRDCSATECDYEEPHRHGFACGPSCPCGEGMTVKDRRSKKCQHCYRRVRLLPSDDPGAPDRAVDSRGEPECVPGLLHKVMPGGEGEVVG